MDLLQQIEIRKEAAKSIQVTAKTKEAQESEELMRTIIVENELKFLSAVQEAVEVISFASKMPDTHYLDTKEKAQAFLDKWITKEGDK